MRAILETQLKILKAEAHFMDKQILKSLSGHSRWAALAQDVAQLHKSMHLACYSSAWLPKSYWFILALKAAISHNPIGAATGVSPASYQVLHFYCQLGGEMAC